MGRAENGEGFFWGWRIELKSFINRNIMALILKPLGFRENTTEKNVKKRFSPDRLQYTKMYSIIYELCFTKFKRVFCDLLIRFSLSIPKNIIFFSFHFLTSQRFFFKEGIFIIYIQLLINTLLYFYFFPNQQSL